MTHFLCGTLLIRALTDPAIINKRFNLKQYKQHCTAEVEEVAIKMHLL